MLKSMKTGVSTSNKVYFQMFLPSLASVKAAYPCFARSCSFLSKYQFRRNREKSNHMLSATSHIGLEFLTKFLNMSKLQKLQTQLISVYRRVPLHHSPGFMHDVPVIIWNYLIIFVVNRETKLMLLGYSGTIIIR